MQKAYHTPAALQTALAAAINGNQELPDHDLVYDDVVIGREIISSIQDLNILVTQLHVRDRSAQVKPAEGIIALFEGSSNSSKLLIGNLLAKQAGVQINVVDLSTVVSRYIGETEKNLAKIFDEANSSGNILFFDEADALFGKRSGVKDSHDRYANIELSYFMKLAEDRSGLTIISINNSTGIDKTVLRRIRTTISFPKK